MSLEAIREIQRVEESMDQARAQARAQAQKIVADARQQGLALLQQGKAEAAAELAEAMKGAEQSAKKRREEILAAAKQDGKDLAAYAENNMAQAVEMIIERVVER